MHHSISGLVVEYIVAIDVTRVRFPADAYFDAAKPWGRPSSDGRREEYEVLLATPVFWQRARTDVRVVAVCRGWL